MTETERNDATGTVITGKVVTGSGVVTATAGQGAIATVLPRIKLVEHFCPQCGMS
jgi:predicted RNA-binding Zn-ribbon protein involved in translation (DUF1610 family)